MSRPWTLPGVAQMAEPKQRAPFKSGIDDFTELNKRVRELGIWQPPGSNEAPTPEPAAPPPTQQDDYYGCG